MKYIYLILPSVLVLAFIGIGTAFRPKVGKPRIPSMETVIRCAPPESDLAADHNGKFIIPLPGLGNHVYRISTREDSTQFYFNQGINFYYSYHLREALASFKEAARFDSSAAMTWWGQALSMGPYFNAYTYKMKSGVPAALASMNRHRDNATAKEQGLIDAMQQRYSRDTTNADRVQLDKAYAIALSTLVKEYPGDNDIKALYIDAVMLEHKWDFYNTDRSPKQWTPELVALCETILKEEPHHPAALHYYIHLTEASATPSLALAGADLLKDDMPGVSHMVHMATHMYQRNGLFSKGVTVNEEANTASNTEDSLAPMLGLGKNDIVHVFAVQSYCAMNAGMYRKGIPIYLRAREKLVASTPIFEEDPYSQWVYMLPTMALVRLGRWDEILKAVAPGRQWKYAQILDHFARGMANIRYKNLPAARLDLDSLEVNLRDNLLNIRVMPFNTPAECGTVAAGILRGEILFAENRQDAAISAFDSAAAAEDSLIYREPQQWLIPARQYLGMYLLKMNKAREAEHVYRQDLDRNPGNGWSLLGLYQSLSAQQKSAEAANVKAKYQKAFEACDVSPVASVF
jgi:tetratricopeptide (TPR) repeat protein